MQPQFFVNTATSSLLLVTVALGFSIPYCVTRFFNVNQAACIPIGAYSAYVLTKNLECPWLLAWPASVAMAILYGLVIDGICFRPMYRREASPVVMLLASLGLYVCTQNALAIAFGNAARVIVSDMTVYRATELGVSLTVAQVTGGGIAMITVCLAVAYLKWGGMGQVYAATADSKNLAMTCGIEPRKVERRAQAIGNGLMGTAGFWIAIDVGMVPTMGLPLFLAAVAGAVLGGTRSAYGVLAGAVILSLLQQTITLTLGAQWSDCVAFAVLLCVIAYRPNGLVSDYAVRV